MTARTKLEHKPDRRDDLEHKKHHGHPPYYCPRRKVLLKTETGHTIVLDDRDEEEFLKVIDRAGQILHMECRVKRDDSDRQCAPPRNQGRRAGRPARHRLGHQGPEGPDRDHRSVPAVRALGGVEGQGENPHPVLRQVPRPLAEDSHRHHQGQGEGPHLGPLRHAGNPHRFHRRDRDDPPHGQGRPGRRDERGRRPGAHSSH
ncbi:MAG: hypothetical protein MZV70_52155 [Desulfobacterales bacterium]|nr:hypothetical protein [Desulfobacterales bacterium]